MDYGPALLGGLWPTAFGGLQQGRIWWMLTWYSFVDCSMALFGDCGIPVSLNLWFIFWGLCFIICPSGRAYMQQCPGQLTYSSHGARFVHASAIHSAFPRFNHACIHLCIYVCAFVRAQVLPWGRLPPQKYILLDGKNCCGFTYSNKPGHMSTVMCMVSCTNVAYEAVKDKQHEKLQRKLD